MTHAYGTEEIEKRRLAFEHHPPPLEHTSDSFATPSV